MVPAGHCMWGVVVSQAGQEGHVVIYCFWFSFPSRRTAITQMWRMPDYSNQVQLTHCFLDADSEQKLSFHACWGGGVCCFRRWSFPLILCVSLVLSLAAQLGDWSAPSPFPKSQIFEVQGKRCTFPPPHLLSLQTIQNSSEKQCEESTRLNPVLARWARQTELKCCCPLYLAFKRRNMAWHLPSICKVKTKKPQHPSESPLPHAMDSELCSQQRQEPNPAQSITITDWRTGEQLCHQMSQSCYRAFCRRGGRTKPNPIKTFFFCARWEPEHLLTGGKSTVSLWTICVLTLKVMLRKRVWGDLSSQNSHLLSCLFCPMSCHGYTVTSRRKGVGAGACAVLFAAAWREGRERKLPAGKQVIPSRRNKAYVIFNGLVSSFSAEQVSAEWGRASMWGWDPFLEPAAPWKGCNLPTSPAHDQRHQPLPQGAHVSSCPSLAGSSHQPGTPGELCDSSCSWLRRLCSITSQTGLHSVTICLSVTRLATVNTLSTMHVGVQAPPLPTKFKLLLTHAMSCEQRAAAASMRLVMGTPLHHNTQEVSRPFSSCSFLHCGLIQFFWVQG